MVYNIINRMLDDIIEIIKAIKGGETYENRQFMMKYTIPHNNVVNNGFQQIETLTCFFISW